MKTANSPCVTRCWRALVLFAGLGLGITVPTKAYPQVQTQDRVIPVGSLVQPADLVKELQQSGNEKPLVLQVGSHVLFAQAHVPGSEYVGAAGQQAGLEALRGRVRDPPRDRAIVLYCGCCPWEKCPNIRPAYQELRSLGFTQVRALYLPVNFGTDWVARGYPTAKGE
jgi:thiosulfate/3-mercaptopyruvate sulfurtransferase